MRVDYGAEKEGYYFSSGSPIIFSKHSLGKWQPWNQKVQLVLKKIVNPVPMYAKHVKREIPVLDQEVGYDLMVGDWVAPHGSGNIQDFKFQCKKRYVEWNDFDFELEVRFKEGQDGIVQINYEKKYGSALLLPRESPEGGFQDVLIKKASGQTLNSNNFPQENCAYFFKVRSDHAGGPLYGKIINDFEFGLQGAKTARISFTYYLNPDGTRNMEFDPERNLFKLGRKELPVKDP